MDFEYADALNQAIRLLSLRHRARAAALLAPSACTLAKRHSCSNSTGPAREFRPSSARRSAVSRPVSRS